MLPIEDCRRAGTNPPVDLFVQGSRVRTRTRREREPLQEIIIVFVDIQEGPVYLDSINDVPRKGIESLSQTMISLYL